MVEELVLGVLSGGDMAGYAIKVAIEANFSVFCKVSFGSLHPAFKRLENSGCVTATEVMQGGRKSIVYHLTEKGHGAFFNWLTSPMAVVSGTNENLAKISFFDRLSPEVKDIQLRSFLKNNDAYLKNLYEIRDKLEGIECFSDSYYKLSTLYYGICITERAMEWCRHILERKPLRELLKENAE